MRTRNFVAALALGIAALSISGCATGLNTKVSRYQAASIPLGQTFYVVPDQGAATPEFYHYASMISQQLQSQGYRPAGAPGVADMLVKLDYGVDQGRKEYVTQPYMGGSRYGWGSYGYGWRDHFFDPRWGQPHFRKLP